MVVEKTGHFARGIRPLRIGVRAAMIAAKPRMPGTVYQPLLNDNLPTGIGVDGAVIGSPPRNATGVAFGYCNCCDRPIPYTANTTRCRLRGHLFAVAGVHCGIAVAVEHDGRNCR